MKTAFIVVVSLSAGIALGILLNSAAFKRKGQQTNISTGSIMRSVTRLIFITTQISALVWVSLSYSIAIYSTVRLEQVYTMAELSEPAIHTILGVGVLKVLENIFEHNDSAVFGKSKGNSDESSVG